MDTNRLAVAKEVIKEYYMNAPYGIFNSRNIVGDSMKTIYNNNGLVVDMCSGELEVFGLSDEEFKELKRYYFNLNESRIL